MIGNVKGVLSLDSCICPRVCFSYITCVVCLLLLQHLLALNIVFVTPLALHMMMQYMRILLCQHVDPAPAADLMGRTCSLCTAIVHVSIVHLMHDVKALGHFQLGHCPFYWRLCYASSAGFIRLF